MTLLINQICSHLASLYPDKETQLQHAWWILEYVTQKPKVALLTHTITLTRKMQDQIDAIIREHVLEHKPFSYIIGSIPFANCKILTEPPVLIPRMETEEWVVNLINQLKTVPTIATQPFSILDLCSGSGCIAIALAKTFPAAHITAIDIQPHAIAPIKRNIHYNNVDNVTVIQSDLFNALEQKPQFDLIVSNPPYVTLSEYENLDHSITRWEDPQALRAHDDGLAIIKRIIQQAPLYLHDSRYDALHAVAHLVIEIGHAQADSVKTIMKTEQYKNIQIIKDCAQKDRIVIGRASYVELEKRKSSYCNR